MLGKAFSELAAESFWLIHQAKRFDYLSRSVALISNTGSGRPGRVRAN